MYNAFDEVFVPKIFKEILQLNNETQPKKGGKYLNEYYV